MNRGDVSRYSYLNAFIGSIFDALSAGMNPAPSATIAKATVEAVSTLRSLK